MVTGNCIHCGCQIHLEAEVWVDNTGGDVCGWNGGNEPHENGTEPTCE